MQNRLADAPSPYLQQHATNPVAWQPWDEEALDAARESGRPILLSIGYASCHWCHVMAHESFEDEATAAVMNEHFVNIKVDREERPDLDKVYQLAHQLLTQNSGGWPLTMFLDPETRLPFFGGTYFPKTAQYGLPAFVDLLRRISTVFAEQREALGEQGAKISDVLARLAPTPTDAALEDTALLQAARDALASLYDERHHGFGSAPKFPMPTTVERLLRHWAYGQRQGERDRKALDMVMLTLTALSRGGCYDHIGGGFYRYSVDREWQVPHFEKMLYDNGLLLELFADALSIGPDALFDGAARDTAAWLLREMRAPDGAFYAALDADSEGEEGRFYVWRREQVKRLLSEDEYLLAETLYGLDKPANFESKWNLRRSDSWRSVVQRLSLDEPEASRLLASARGKLFDARSERPRPGLDAKVLTAWNGLAIAGLCRAGTVLSEPTWIDAAEAATEFLRRNCWRDGELYATWQDGQPLHRGYLDDYAFLLHAVLLLLRVRWRGELVTFARALADAAIEHFEDPEHGGFFFTANDHEALIHRPKPTHDDAQPPGNGVLCRSLIELGHLFAEPRYLEAAERTLSWARGAMEQQPANHCSLLSALEDFSQPPETVILRGPAELIASWRAAIDVGYRPWRMIYAVPYDDAATAPPYLPRLVSAETQAQATAFVCQGLSCSLPINDLEALKETLSV